VSEQFSQRVTGYAQNEQIYTLATLSWEFPLYLTRLAAISNVFIFSYD
jgi:hypothetical protein